MKLTKKQKLLKTIIKKKYGFTEGINLIKKNSKDFESIDIAVVLGIDGKKSDQVVKGVVENVPSGLGKDIKIAVFSKNNINTLKEAGAAFVGFEDLYNDIKSSKVKADIYLASQELIPELAKMGIGRLLKNKMPNPKLGTIVPDIELINLIKKKKSGQIIFRSNLNLIHTSIGRATFSSEELKLNFDELIKSIKNVKPKIIKPNLFIKKIYCSSTQGTSVELDN